MFRLSDPAPESVVPPVCVVDPGKASGVVVAAGGEVCAYITDRQETLLLAEEFAQAHADGVLVAERFVINERTIRAGRDDTALRIIGVLERVAELGGLGFVLQTPAEAKRLIPDWRLRALGLHAPGKQDHARDALRHYCVWRAKRGMRLPVEEW